MRRARALVTCAAGLTLLNGCVYYNGVYNARRLTRDAERAEREGRTIEARDYWGRVVVKADSVIARHPASGYVTDVQLLRGRALARMDQCADAIPALEQSVRLSTDSAAVEAGTFELARCQALGGNMVAAADAYRRLLASRDPIRRRDARYEYVHALRLAGQYTEALAALDSLDDPRASAERMVALGGAGQLPAAFMIADSGIARSDTTLPWDALLSAAGRANPVEVSRFVDRLSAMPSAPPPMRARWLLDDGERLLKVDTARADARLAEAATIGATSEAAALARMRRVELALRRVRIARDLAPVVDSLEQLQLLATTGGTAAELYAAAVRVRAAADSADRKPPQGDLALFLAAELARDALDTPVLAMALFQRLVTDWPESAYAPKALLAMHRLDPVNDGDSVRALLDQRYPTSPYVLALHGQDAPSLQVLEDSMSAFAAAHGVESFPVNGARPGAQPGVQPGAVPGARPGDPARPAGGARRPAEPL